MNKMNLVNLKKDPVVKTGLQNRLVIGTQDRMISIPNGYSGSTEEGVIPFLLEGWKCFMEEVTLEL